ncbi:MAG: DUF1593 domain-containing protein, partial [Candidatus Omnitrophica bacterium]|nr:DUF1593 domain-containing protein [Candidatus Omnitrophota bacterium]
MWTLECNGWSRSSASGIRLSGWVLMLVLVGAIQVFLFPGHKAQAAGAAEKIRTIVTTDGEIDDRCSMVRFLLYANEWDILGLIHSSSKYHWKGDENHPEHDYPGTEWLDRQLDAYSEVYPNLKKHRSDFPTADALRALVSIGNVEYEGAMDKETPGSERIVKALLDSDPSPIWLQAWGGANTIARALQSIEENHPDRMEEVSKKAKVFMISEQDQTYRDYIEKRWPDVEVLLSTGSSFGSIAYHWQPFQSEETAPYFGKEWMTSNILENHGPLCSMYEAKDGRFRSEGDSPAFLHLIDNGLRADTHPSYGGWGGRFRIIKGMWKSVDKKGMSGDDHSIIQWAVEIQNDFAARADWCVATVEEANHPPVVQIE